MPISIKITCMNALTILQQNKWLAFGLTGVLLITAVILAGIFYSTQVREFNEQSEIVELTDEPTGLPLVVDVQRLPTLTLPPTATIIPSATPTQTSTNLPPTATAEVSVSQTPVPTLVAEVVEQPTENSQVECVHPEGWEVYHIQDGDTLFAFQLGANRAGNPATVDEILAANCLDSNFLSIGQALWLPPGAAENAPSSEPAAPSLPAGLNRTASCPCTITVREGWRIEQIADEINRTPVAFTGADFLAYTRRGTPIPDRWFLTSVPRDKGLEGFMYPGAYTLQNDTTAEQFRDMLLNAFENNVASYLNSAGNYGMTGYELVILASIIQKESYAAQEQVLVSSVFHNRRNSDKGFAASVTIMYALGGPGDWWPRLQSGQTGLDTPYNTNIYKGFPPTPISNPGASALQAAAQPAQTNYIYFTGNCQGTGNAYAATYEEHLANVRCE